MKGKILATLLCASMALGMMGCGSGNGGGSTLLMNGNEPTDLFFMCPEVREDVEATDFAEDLSKLPIMDKLSDSAKRTLGINGKVYGLSLDSWASFFFYNKEVFDKAGIKETPTTWDELVEDMEKIKKIGVEPMTAQSEDAGRL